MYNKLPQRFSPSSRRGVMLTAVAMLLMVLAGLRPAAPALASCGGVTTVGTYQQLYDAIDDFNGNSGPCDFTIRLTNDITVPDDEPIDIIDAGPTANLTIDGDSHTLDFGDVGDGLNIEVEGEVHIHDITLANSSYRGIRVEEGLVRLSRVTIERSYEHGIQIDGGEVVVEDSAIIHNGWHGIYSDDVYGAAVLSVINSTIANNNDYGLMLWDTHAYLNHATIFGNTVGLYMAGSSDVVIHNSILAGSWSDCQLTDTGIMSVEYSLVQNNGDGNFSLCDVADGVDGNIVGVDPLLAPLGNYGGPTATVPPVNFTGIVTATSPVIDSGDSDLSTDFDAQPLTTDQRGAGFPRLVGSEVDMGAFEGQVDVACSASMTVGADLELAHAILCFNQLTAAGSTIIEFDDDITLAMAMPMIANDTDGISLLIDGAGHTLDGDDQFDTFIIDYTPDVMIDMLTITGSDAAGIYADYSNVRVTRSTIKNSNWEGIDLHMGNLFVVESTIANNDEDGVDFNSYGELYELYIINSTLFRNGVADDYAALSVEGGYTTVVNSTIFQNGFGIYVYQTDLTVNNSILAGNKALDCQAYESAESFNNSLVQVNDEFNPCDVADGVDGNIVGVDPKLGALGDYGGPTQTIPPLQFTGGITSVSPAVNAGDNDLAEDEDGDPLATDQRGAGFPRVVGGTVDMGAFEGTHVVNCPAFPRTVGNQTQLNDAILCYGGITIPGVYTINLSGVVNLTASTPIIDNATAGVSLVINGHAIDGQGSANTRPITVAPDTTVTLTGILITGGNSEENGGGVFNAGDLTIINSRVNGNTTLEDGGGIHNAEDATLTLLDHTLVNQNLAAFPDGDGGGINNAGVATLTDVTVSGNAAEGDSLVIGGGILNEGSMTITRGVIANNSVDAEDYEAVGGGIANQAYLVIRDSAITGNSLSAGFYDAFGGGISSDASDEAVEEYGAELLIINSTISGNIVLAEENARGGGLYAEECCAAAGSVSATLINTTLAGNFATAELDAYGGGAYFAFWGSSSDVTINNSILANNTTNGAPGGDCVRNASDDLIFESRHSLYEDTGEGACELAAANPDTDGNIVGQDPDLGPLGNNGGPTLTHLPDAGSPAIDAGDNTLALDEGGDPLETDQRGYTPRVVNGTVDMGAVEVGAEGPASDAAVFMSAKTNGSTTDGVSFDNSDILMWDGSAWSMFFDGSAALLMPNNKPKHNNNAFWIGDGEIIMSFAQNRRFVPDISVPVDGTDLVRWDGTDFSFWFDGSDVDLTQKTAEKIDGLHVLPGSESPIGSGCIAYLLISTQGPGKVPNHSGGTLKFGGEDVLGFCATQLGLDTAGLWHMVLDGSAEGLPKNAIDSISADGDTLYFTTSKVINLGGGVVGGHSMIYAYDTNTGDFSGPLFKAADNGLKAKVDGLDMGGGLP